MYVMRLSEVNFVKRRFDPSSKKDRTIAYTFLEKKKWHGITDTNTCPFFCEWPYLDIPSMLRERLVNYYASANK